MPVTLTALTVTALPLRRVYAVGSAFDGAGMVLTASYSDGSSAPVEDGYTVSFDPSSPGQVNVTLGYEGMTAGFSLTVTGVKGDVDGDGTVTSTDARMTLLASVDALKNLTLDPALSEVDGDGSTTSTDARLMLQYAVEMIDEWPAAA